MAQNEPSCFHIIFTAVKQPQKLALELSFEIIFIYKMYMMSSCSLVE
jgi:hypothetical protein